MESTQEFRKEEKKAIDRFKCGKAAGGDVITAEMLEYGGETVVDGCEM